MPSLSFTKTHVTTLILSIYPPTSPQHPDKHEANLRHNIVRPLKKNFHKVQQLVLTASKHWTYLGVGSGVRHT